MFLLLCKTECHSLARPAASHAGCVVGGSARRHIRGVLVSLGAIVLAVMLQPFALAQQRFTDRENSIKAAYLYNFGRYTEWLTDNQTQKQFVIGIVGRTPVAEALAELAKKRNIHGQRIVVRQIQDVKSLQACRIVFFSGRQKLSAMAPLLKGARQLPILTVGETDGFAEAGGVMNFHLKKNRLRFEINPTAAGRARLKLSAKLLRLGTMVQER